MSVIPPPPRPLQQFFRSGPMPCPYLPGRVERKLFTRLTAPYASEVNSTLSRAGFRRSYDIVYRPVCPGCSACVPVRIPVKDFQPGRSMRRILKANADLSVAEVPAIATHEQFRLFHAYQMSRHGDSDMARMSLGDYSAMVDEGRAETCLFEVRDSQDRLVGAILTDRLRDGLSAVYSFFDAEPGQAQSRHLHDPVADFPGTDGGPALRLSRLLDQKQPQDGLQGPLSTLGGARSRWMVPDGA